jgi:hypothetical protein
MAGARNKRASRSIFGLVVPSALVLVLAACITNPGEFTLTMLEGSTFTLTDLSGNPTIVTTLSDTPSCGDAIDNDLDGLTDYPGDPACASSDDDNERLSGLQSLPGSVATMIEIDAAGGVSGDPSDFEIPQRERCIDTGESGVWCLGITVHGVGSTQTGTVNTTTHEITLALPLAIELDALTGFPGLDLSCHIGPIDTTLVADDYNTTTGAATLEVADAPVPAVSGCGGGYDDLFNLALSLPGHADVVALTTILDADGGPIVFDS